MQIPEINASEFSALVAKKQFKQALQSVFGIGDKPVLYARAFIIQLNTLSEEDRQEFLKWSSAPMELQPLEELRWYVDTIARHEVGHAITARLMGFRTGGVTLMLNAANGNHVATTELILDTAPLDFAGLRRYLESRIMVLMAGAMAEAEDVRGILSAFNEASTGAESDRQKCDELFQVLCNMRNDQDNEIYDDQSRYWTHLVQRAVRIVMINHPVIVRVGKRLSQAVENYGQAVTWTAEEFDAILSGEHLTDA